MFNNSRCLSQKIFSVIATTISIVFVGALPISFATGETGLGQTVSGRSDFVDTKTIDAIFGRSGEMKDTVYKIGLPRTDLKVTADGVDIKPGLALGSWVAFKRSGNHAVVMGDLVLLENEVNPVLSKLEENGIEISAIHNHILNEQPRILYMHYMGHGSEEKLARAVKEALTASATPLGIAPSPAPQAPPTAEWKKVQDIIGVQGRERGGVLQIGVARKEKIAMADGTEVPAFMGTATAINFQLSPKGAATTGDFVMTATEVNPVIRELRKAGIQITALHSHMLDESPRLFFMHFWGNDDPVRLARGLKAALDKTNSAL
ncbi:MAG: DUF1259 domain-containing protein [Blastocatellia bacterium]